MQLLVYIVTYPLLWVISILPHPLFYALSDFLYVLVYRVFGYRKKVVRKNLEITLPEKSASEIKGIEKKFYRHFCDSMLESVKGLTMGAETVKKKYRVPNVDVITDIEKRKSILIICAHYANWEWNTSLSLHVKSKGYAVYQRINNHYFDNLIKRIRAKWNTTMIDQQETVKVVMQNHRNDVRSIYGMVSDQSPQVSRAHYWAPFMGITVPVFTGVESMARKMDLAVVFLKVSKLKRGHYSAEFIPITENGKSTEPNEITDRFLRLTEEQIREAPEYYLWTHKRWKHRNKVPAAFATVKEEGTITP